ncbi:MAG: hypothetical protein AAFT19_06210 [Pseudomonadota bacterium]
MGDARAWPPRLLVPLCCLAVVVSVAGCRGAPEDQALHPLKGSVDEARQVAGLDGSQDPTAVTPVSTGPEGALAPLAGEPVPASTEPEASDQEEVVAPTGIVIEPPVLRRPSGQSWGGLGLRLLAEADYVQAERAFNRALAQGDVRRETLAGMGIAAAGQGHLARAERFLRAALVLVPEDADTNAALGALLVQRGDDEAARSHLRTAFVVSSGQHEVAAQQLALVEARLARRLPRDIEAEEAVAFRTQRLGRSEYRLVSLDASAQAAPEIAADGSPTSGSGPVPAVAAVLAEPDHVEDGVVTDDEEPDGAEAPEVAQSVPNGETDRAKDGRLEE